MTLPYDLQKIIDFFNRLPGIGPKTARRLGFFLLKIPQEDLTEFATALSQFRKKITYCNECNNIAEETLCSICSDKKRDHNIITVVEEALDIISFESGTQYEGIYHILGGRIDPANYIGPEDLSINKLLYRIEKNPSLKEIILATNPTTEGEATAMYIYKLIEELNKNKKRNITVTRLAYGLPIGADLEYTDYLTLKRAIEGRKKMG